MNLLPAGLEHVDGDVVLLLLLLLPSQLQEHSVKGRERERQGKQLSKDHVTAIMNFLCDEGLAPQLPAGNNLAEELR